MKSRRIRLRRSANPDVVEETSTLPSSSAITPDGNAVWRSVELISGDIDMARSLYNMGMNPELREKGYGRAPGLLDPTLARVLFKTLLLQHWRGECFRDNHMPTASSVSNTALTDALLLEMRPRIEAITGCALVPTYSYARVYFHGD